MNIPLSKKAQSFKPGVYKHYKGDLYFAFFVGRLSEDRDKEFVVYKSFTKGSIWMRPLEMFLEDLEVNGKKEPRFRWVGEKI